MLIAVVTFDHPDNHRAPLTERTVDSLMNTVDLAKHRIYISDNGSTDPNTIKVLAAAEKVGFGVIRNGRNLGTAKAVNQVIKLRKPAEVVTKVDNDMVFNECGWAEWIELAASKIPDCGIIGAKLKMIGDTPWNPADYYRTTLVLLPHSGSERWCPVEFGHYIPGACQAYTPLLLDKIGSLRQPGNNYAWDDVIACRLSEMVGLKNVFLHINVDHIDPGYAPYQKEKGRIAAEAQGGVMQMLNGYIAHPETIYVEP